MCKIFLFVLMVVSCAYGCDETFTSSTGTIKSPNYPSNYPKGKSCTYEIKVWNRWVKLSWNNFNINGKMPDCNNGYVQVSIGCSSDKKLLSKFCSNNMNALPHDIYAKDGCIQLKFYSSSSATTKQGFFATYSSYPSNTPASGSSCKRNSYFKRKSSGIIISPNWPLPYESYMFTGGSCEWDIETGDSKKVIKLNFMAMDVGRSASCRYSSEYVKVEGKKSSLTSSMKEYYYCQSSPFSLTTKYYEVDVKMKAFIMSWESKRTGFVVGFVAYTDDDAVKATNIGMIAGAVIAVLFVLLVAFCCYRRFKRRQSMSQARVPLNAGTTTTVTHSAAQPPPDGYPKQPYNYQPPPQGYGGVPPTQNYPMQPQPYPASQQYPPPMSQGYQATPAPDVAPPPYPGPPTGYQTSPYPPQAQPYPPQAQPYPPPAQPYPPPAQPYPNSSAPYPTNNPEKASAPPM